MFRLMLFLAVFFAIGLRDVDASPVALSSAMELNTRARLYSPLCVEPESPCTNPTVTDTDGQSQLVTLGPLSASVSAFVELFGSTIYTSGQALATWASASAGSVHFNSLGWNTVDVGTTSNGVYEGEARLANLTLSNPNWNYTFIADATGLFTMNYQVEGTPDLSGFQFYDPQHMGGRNAANNTSGTFTMDMVAGDTYTVGINNLIVIGGAMGSRTASTSAVFDWSMDTLDPVPPVPEPGSLLLLGSGVVGLVVRMRRSTKR